MFLLAFLFFCNVLNSILGKICATPCVSSLHVIRDDFSNSLDAASFLQISKMPRHGKEESKNEEHFQEQKKWVDSTWSSGCPDYTLPAKEQKSTLVLVRTHTPSKGMVDRMAKWAEDLHQHPHVALMLMNSVDDTGLQDPWRSQIDKKVKDIPYTMFHQTDSARVRKEFPVWVDTKYTHKERWIFGQVWKPTGWDTHTEFILLAVEQARRSGRLHDDGYVWVIEDDVGVCGNMSEFIASYGNDTSDFIATAGLEKAPWDWRHYWEGSDEFAAKFEAGERWHAAEHVERFSVRFLMHLDDLIRNKRITAHSEMFAPTVCQNSKEFSCSLLEERNLFEPKYFEHAARVKQAAWEEICPSTQLCHSPPFLAHALKW